MKLKDMYLGMKNLYNLPMECVYVFFTPLKITAIVALYCINRHILLMEMILFVVR